MLDIVFFVAIAISMCMAKHNKKQPSRPKRNQGHVARGDGESIRSWTVGALPIINRILDRLKLEETLTQYLGREDRRTRVPVAKCLLLLVRNILLSREPIYGLGEWAQRHAPDLLGLTAAHLEHLNDDRVGRALDKLFVAMEPQLLMDFVRQMIQEFDLNLDELHNDSTTVTFSGAYPGAAVEGQELGRRLLAITWGHTKDHRPDLKQLLYVLTITNDGGVPLYYSAASGNMTDDQTHRETWNLLCDVVGHSQFLYVADCKAYRRSNVIGQREHEPSGALGKN
jgi:transposase